MSLKIRRFSWVVKMSCLSHLINLELWLQLRIARYNVYTSHCYYIYTRCCIDVKTGYGYTSNFFCCAVYYRSSSLYSGTFNSSKNIVKLFLSLCTAMVSTLFSFGVSSLSLLYKIPALEHNLSMFN